MNSLGGSLGHSQPLQDKFDEIEKIFAYNAGNALVVSDRLERLDLM